MRPCGPGLPQVPVTSRAWSYAIVDIPSCIGRLLPDIGLKPQGGVPACGGGAGVVCLVNMALSSALRHVLTPGKPQGFLTTHCETKDYPLPQNLRSWSVKVYSSSALPHQVVVGLVSTPALAGDISKNAFKFSPYGLSSIALKVNGPTLPSEKLEVDFTTGNFNNALLHLYMHSGKYRVNSTNSITAENFKTTCCLWPFDLSPGMYLRWKCQGGVYSKLFYFRSLLAVPLSCCSSGNH